MTKVQQLEMKKTENKKECEATGILKLPYYLLTVSGYTLSTDGVTISRRMVVYSGAIYVLNLIIILKGVTCFDKDDSFQLRKTTDKIIEVFFQVSVQISCSIMLYSSAKKLPEFFHTLEKQRKLIRDKSFNDDVQKSLKRNAIKGLVVSTMGAFSVAVFRFMGNPSLEWEVCLNHRWFFSSEQQHNYFKRGLGVATLFSGFQCVAGLSFCLTLCRSVTLYFKYLHNRLNQSVAFLMEMESGGNEVEVSLYFAKETRRIRYLYEHTCDLTAKLDDAISMFIGHQLLVLIPIICLFTLSAFVPVLGLDLLVYDLFASFFVLLTVVITATLNSQVKIFQIFLF